MSVKVLIPNHLSQYVNHQSELEVEAADLKGMLERVSRDYNLDDTFLTRDGDLQSFIRLIVDEQFVTMTKAEDLASVPVAGKTVEIKTAFAGG